MAIVSTAAAAATIVAGAQQVFESGRDLAAVYNKYTSTSLTQVTRETTILSRAYIDGALRGDPVVTDILRSCHELYAGMILSALKLNRLVTSSSTVRDMLAPISTESFQGYNAAYEDVRLAMAQYCGRMLSPAYEANDIVPSGNDARGVGGGGGSNHGHGAKVIDADYHVVPSNGQKSNADGTIVTPEIGGTLPLGKILQVTFHDPGNPSGTKETVDLRLQMIPYNVPQTVMVEFMTHTGQSWKQRTMMWNSGEIGFWSGLLFQKDLIERRAQIVKQDTTGVFYNFLRNTLKKDGRRAMALAENRPEKTHNLANSVIVVSQDTMNRAKAVNGIDLKRPADRQRFFQNTYSMIIAVVDTLFNTITIYYNGIDDHSTFSFDQMKPPKKGSEAVDLLKALQELGLGRAPRL